MSDSDIGHDPFPGTTVDWTDGAGRSWHISLQTDRIILSSGNDAAEFPSASWARDIYVAPHGGGFIVRFSTFQQELGFVVPAEQARPLLDALQRAAGTPAQICAEVPEETPAKTAPLLWPKVSPLAVWALMTSALVFLPVVGFLPAIATITLLIVHRRAVRRGRAWAHSRALCLAAFVFLIAGLGVWALSTRGLVHTLAPHTDLPAQVSVAMPGPGPEPEPVAHLARHVPLAQLDHLADRNWGLIGAALVVVLLSLTVHEASHGIAAWWLGDDLARRLGRVTLNPMAHVDPFGTILLPLILFLTNVGMLFGWAKPVPVRMEYTSNPRRAHILVSLAGPGANLLLAAASMLLLLGIGCSVSFFLPDAVITEFSGFDPKATATASGFALAPVVGPLCTVLKLGFVVNVLLAFFNLIPVPPLDGSWVLEHLFPRALGPLYRRIRPFAVIVFLALIYTKVLFYLLVPALVVLKLGFAMLSLCTRF